MPNPLPQPSVTDHYDPRALGLLARYSPGGFRDVFGADAAHAVHQRPVSEVMREIANAKGISVRAAMTSDDFLLTLTDLAHAAGIMGYAYARPEVLRLSNETLDIKDFRPVERIAGGKFPLLLEVPEGAEVQYGNVGDGRKETYQAARFSRLIQISEEALVNDNLGLLVQPALDIGGATAETKGAIVVSRIVDNPVMSDGLPVFHADHGNLAATGSPLSIASLSAARTALRRQTENGRVINVTPHFLVVPPELETDAQQLVATITANTSDTVNPFAGTLEVLTDPRLTDPNAWYLFARPERRLTLEHGRVEGTEDPEVRTEPELTRHVITTRVSTTFACGWIDYRGAYLNPGA